MRSRIHDRKQSDLYGYTSVTGAFRSIVQREGVRGLFAGYGSMALRDAPFAGLYVSIYEHLKRTLGDEMPAGSPGTPPSAFLNRKCELSPSDLMMLTRI